MVKVLLLVDEGSKGQLYDIVDKLIIRHPHLDVDIKDALESLGPGHRDVPFSG